MYLHHRAKGFPVVIWGFLSKHQMLTNPHAYICLYACVLCVSYGFKYSLRYNQGMLDFKEFQDLWLSKLKPMMANDLNISSPCICPQNQFEGKFTCYVRLPLYHRHSEDG